MRGAIAILFVALWTQAVAAQAATGPSAASASGSAQPDPLIADLESYVGEGDAQLIIMGSAADSPPPGPPPGSPSGNVQRVRVCNGQPALMTRSSVEGNGACFGPNVSTTLSCSCIDDLEGLTTWQFRVKAPEPKTAEPQPLTMPSSTVLGINSMLIFTVPRTLVSFSLIAETEKPLQLQLMVPPGPQSAGTTPSLVRAPSTNVLETLEIANIALGSVKIEENNFVPSNVQNLTFRNCNLARLRSTFLDSFLNLQSLDVSKNQLAGAFQDLTTSFSVYPLKSLNLSGNTITQLPSNLMSFSQLRELDLSQNPIRNFSTDNATVDAFSKLKTFKLSTPTDNVTCDGGVWRQVQDSRLCVPVAVADTSKGSVLPVTTAEPASSSKTLLIAAPIGGLVVIALVVFVALRLRSRRKQSDDKDVPDSLFESTAPYDNSHGTVDPTLINDPIIITHRIPYKELRLANCISKGGFGLVYSGVYNRRRVAIKKIRPDRAGDIKQIESFLKEICLMATLNHPRIVEFVGVSWDSLRNLCAVTEFMERGDLREVLHGFKLRNTPLTWESNKTAIALHIAEGLTYLHSLSPKVIHRDLKSKNVLLNGEMTAKLSDFGISREFDIDVTHMTAGIGTSFWIAPEVLLGKDYDEHADIFSFGVVLSEIDTDDYPYWNASNAESGGRVEQNVILQLVASGSLRPSFSDTCPQQILELAEMCLQVDPNQRPTAAEVTYELQRMIATLPPHSSSGFSSSSYY